MSVRSVYVPPPSPVALRPVFGSWPPLSWFRSHTQTHHTRYGLLWTSDQPDAETSTWIYTTLTKKKYIHASGGIRTRNPSKRAAADPCFRPRGQRDRQIYIKHSYYTCYYNGAINTWPVLLSDHAGVAANTLRETVLCFTFRALPMYCTSSIHKNKLEGNRLR